MTSAPSGGDAVRVRHDGSRAVSASTSLPAGATDPPSARPYSTVSTLPSDSDPAARTVTVPAAGSGTRYQGVVTSPAAAPSGCSPGR